MAFTDNFNRADENLEVSGNWTHDGLVAGALAIRTNNLSNLTIDASGSAYKCPDQGSADHYVQFTVRSAANSGPFVCNRLADRSNFVGIRNNGGTLEVFRRVAGTLTSLNSSAQSIVVGDVLRLECQGTNWRAYRNGVQFVGAAGGGAIGAAGLTNQRQGLVGRTTTQNPWIDNFEAGPLSVTGTLAATETGSDTAALTGSVLVQGALAATETGSDTFAGTGTVAGGAEITGTMSAAETGGDTFSGTGTVSGSEPARRDATDAAPRRPHRRPLIIIDITPEEAEEAIGGAEVPPPPTRKRVKSAGKLVLGELFKATGISAPQVVREFVQTEIVQAYQPDIDWQLLADRLTEIAIEAAEEAQRIEDEEEELLLLAS